jgi:chemotaxis protein methyltransferase CheR
MSLKEPSSGIQALSAREFEKIQKLAYEKFGLNLRDGKETLVSARLNKTIRRLNFTSFDQYFRFVCDDTSGAALTELIDSLTTNHTSFFREAGHFQFLSQTILPALRERSTIAIWSAACSSGEEPYSIAFNMLDDLGETNFSKVRILATDISTRMLDHARQATYPVERFNGIPVQQLRRYVLRGSGESNGFYRVKPHIRAAVEFARVNLMESLSQFGPFPVIFCRNVMIYFDKPTQQAVVGRLTKCLEPGGHLLIGHSESLNSIEHTLQYVRPAIYRKPGKGDVRVAGGLGRR